MQIKTTIIYHYPPIRMANIYIERERERERETDRERHHKVVVMEQPELSHTLLLGQQKPL